MRTDPLDSFPGPSALDRFRQVLASDPPESQALPALLEALEASESLEAALSALRKARPASRAEAGWGNLRQQLEARVQANLERRRSHWHLDPHRRRWRILVSVQPPASLLGPSALQHHLGEGLLAAGLPLALTLSNRPRPFLSLGPVLPLGVESQGEWADLDLREAPGFPPERLREHFGLREGLAIRQAEAIPLQASSLLELARSARWVWICRDTQLAEAQAQLERFRHAESWEIEKSGKAAGQKVIKRIEVRDQLLDFTWQGAELHFETRIQDGAGLNPQKLLGGILGWLPDQFARLRRESVLLGEDPRLSQRDRYETRLHNMFEDAVLLESDPDFPEGSPDGDDEIIRL